MGIEFCQKLSLNLWSDHMVFIFKFVNMMYHIDWFSYIEESLHPQDKPHLMMVDDPFIVLLDSVSWNFVEDFCIYVHQWCWPVIFWVLGASLSDLLSGWCWPCRMRLRITLTSFIQHSFGALSHRNQRRKRNERNPGWKRRNKTVTDRIPHVEIFKDPTRKHQSSSMNLTTLQDTKLMHTNFFHLYATMKNQKEKLRK